MVANKTRIQARRIQILRKKQANNHAKGKIYRGRAGRKLRIKA